MYAFDLQKPIAIGCDHAGLDYKAALISFLEKNNFSVKDFGTYTNDSVDYPDYAHPVAQSVETNECGFGILICGSANGVAITANKHAGIRAAICWKDEIAEFARLHNNANIICIPARFVQKDEAENMVNLFMQTSFEGGRHEKRILKINCN